MSPRRKKVPELRTRETPMVPGAVMRALRHSLPCPDWSASRVVIQSRVAYAFQVHPRTIGRWEEDGAPVPHAWAYVGLAYRVGGADAARHTLQVLTQSELGDGAWRLVP